MGEPFDANKRPTLKDWRKGIDEINLIRRCSSSVDKLNLESQKKPQVKTAVICPSLIFGISHGYDKVNSVQILELIKASVKNNGPFSVYSGEAIWSHIHIHLGELYKVVLYKLVAVENIP